MVDFFNGVDVFVNEDADAGYFACYFVEEWGGVFWADESFGFFPEVDSYGVYSEGDEVECVLFFGDSADFEFTGHGLVVVCCVFF